MPMMAMNAPIAKNIPQKSQSISSMHKPWPNLFIFFSSFEYDMGKSKFNFLIDERLAKAFRLKCIEQEITYTDQFENMMRAWAKK
jgi:hypothetical protein